MKLIQPLNTTLGSAFSVCRVRRVHVSNFRARKLRTLAVHNILYKTPVQELCEAASISIEAFFFGAFIYFLLQYRFYNQKIREHEEEKKD